MTPKVKKKEGQISQTCRFKLYDCWCVCRGKGRREWPPIPQHPKRWQTPGCKALGLDQRFIYLFFPPCSLKFCTFMFNLKAFSARKVTSLCRHLKLPQLVRTTWAATSWGQLLLREPACHLPSVLTASLGSRQHCFTRKPCETSVQRTGATNQQSTSLPKPGKSDSRLQRALLPQRASGMKEHFAHGYGLNGLKSDF